MEFNNSDNTNNYSYSTNLKVEYDSSDLFKVGEVIHFICNEIKIIIQYQDSIKNIKYENLIKCILNKNKEELILIYYNDLLLIDNIIFKIKTGILSEHLNINTTLQKFKKNCLQNKISDNTSKRNCSFCLF